MIITRMEDKVLRFKKFFDLNFPKVKTFAWQLLKSEEDAEDIAQDIFVKLWEKPDLWLEREKLDSYLYTVVRNHIYNFLKHKAVEYDYLDVAAEKMQMADSYWSDNVFTVLRGKLKQAAARGLLSREQLDYLLDRVAEGEAHAGPVQPENGSVQVQCYGCSYTGNIQTVSFRMYTVNAYKVTESGEMYSIDDETSIELMYLPGNGAFLQVGVLDNRLPAAESTPEEQVQAFLTQLDTTLDGSWEQTTTEDGLEYKHTSGVLRVVRYAPDEVDFALCVTLDPDVYGGLDTLSNVVIGPDGTIYTPGGEYGTF